MVLLDSEKAFDSVWIEGLIHKLHTHKISLGMCKIIHSYLSDRYFQVHSRQAISEKFHIPAGVPQGSVSSPTLFNVYISDVFDNLPPRINIAGFADDLSLYTSSSSVEKACNRLQNAASHIIHNLEKWKIKVNTSKTEAILFTQKQSTPKHIKIRSETIPFSHSVKYLGLHLDKRLTFSEHVTQTNTKALRKLGRYYALFKSRTLRQDVKLLIYKAIIRPTMTYASPIWHTTAKTHLQKLQITQNKCIRLATNSPIRTNLETLHSYLQIDLFPCHIKKLADNLRSALPTHPNPLLQPVQISIKPRWGSNRVGRS